MAEGNVYERANGRWEARLSYLDPYTGKRKRVSVYGPTRKAALDKLGEVRDRMAKPVPRPRTPRATVAEWLAHWRQTSLAVSDRKPVDPRAVRHAVRQAP